MRQSKCLIETKNEEFSFWLNYFINMTFKKPKFSLSKKYNIKIYDLGFIRKLKNKNKVFNLIIKNMQRLIA